MRLLALAVLLAVAPGQARATSWEWNATDYSLQGVFVAATCVDWAYTLEFTQHPERYDNRREWNPVLGPHPSRARVNTLVPLAIVSHTLVAAALPHGALRTIWQAAGAWVEIDSDRWNWAGGVALRF